MNFAAIQPRVNFQIAKPIKLSPRGNLYKIAIAHSDNEGQNIRNYEVWTTKEAVQKHFDGMKENPRDYQLKKFARIQYEKRVRSTNGQPQEKGLFVTTDQTTHGDPKLWPHILSHPEIKI